MATGLRVPLLTGQARPALGRPDPSHVELPHAPPFTCHRPSLSRTLAAYYCATCADGPFDSSSDLRPFPGRADAPARPCRHGQHGRPAPALRWVTEMAGRSPWPGRSMIVAVADARSGIRALAICPEGARAREGPFPASVAGPPADGVFTCTDSRIGNRPLSAGTAKTRLRTRTAGGAWSCSSGAELRVGARAVVHGTDAGGGHPPYGSWCRVICHIANILPRMSKSCPLGLARMASRIAAYQQRQSSGEARSGRYAQVGHVLPLPPGTC